MAQQDFIPTVGYEPSQDNSFRMNKNSKATPYFLSYLAANNERPIYEEPVDPIIVDNRPLPKRLAFTILMTLLMAILIATLVLSFVGVLPEYTGLLVKTDEAGSVNIGVDDIIYGSLRKIFSMEVEGDSVFYNDCLQNIDFADTPQMIAYYAMPVSIILAVIVALYILIKSIVACATPKRRKFPYMALILILFTLFGVVSALVWNGAELKLENILAFFLGGVTEVTEGTVNISLGIGYFILLGVEVLNLVFSFLAYRSKKICKF